MIAGSSCQKSQSPTVDSLLETALRVSPLDLARSYLAVQTLMDFLAFAELGAKIQTPIWPEQIDSDNVREVRSELEKRLSSYETAINKRGYSAIAGNY